MEGIKNTSFSYGLFITRNLITNTTLAGLNKITFFGACYMLKMSTGNGGGKSDQVLMHTNRVARIPIIIGNWSEQILFAAPELFTFVPEGFVLGF